MTAPREAVTELLHARGAEQIAHPGGTLLGHVNRVAERLAAHGADDVVTLAALAHAVYGTDGFDTCLLALDERHVLRDAAGEDVENLVYLYAACDRSRSWRALAANREVHDRFTGSTVRPSAEMLARFVDLSIVNEVDVVEQSPEARARYAAPLWSIFDSWRGLGSAVIVADAERVLTKPASPQVPSRRSI